MQADRQVGRQTDGRTDGQADRGSEDEDKHTLRNVRVGWGMGNERRTNKTK